MSFKHDEFHGQGGTYEVRNGKRVRVDKPQEHPAGGGARNAKGDPVDEPHGKEPALPEPQPAPWAEAAKASAEIKTEKKGA